jgi:hypothetical protein
MPSITIDQLEPDIAHLPEQRAAQNGHTIELEITAILKSVLIPKKSMEIDRTTAINQRFADFGNDDKYVICIDNSNKNIASTTLS